MNVGLVEMLRYNEWANSTLLDACRSLTDDQLDAGAPTTSGTTRVLLLHVVGAQQTFVLRTRGRQHEGELDRDSAWPGMDELIDIATRTSAELVSIARSLDPHSEVDLPYEGAIYRYPRRFFLIHAVAHGVEHRTEIKVNLAHIGVDTPSLDGWDYGESAGYGADVTDRG